MDGDRELDGEWDYIVVGAGAAGCVLANRLSADPSVRVLLVEGGGGDRWIWFHIPCGYLFAIGNPRADWLYETVSEPGLNGRSLKYPRGKVIGGSSSINAMISMRGQAADYDGWRSLGLPGWGWADMQPIFRDVDDHFLGDTPHHRAGGEWRVERPRVSWPILSAIADAAAQMGVPRSDDFNTGDNEGVGHFHVNQKRGLRWSASTAFLKPALRRPNLRLVTGALADRVEFSGRRAVGLRFRRGGERLVARAKGEVVLAAGSIGSAAILQRSGVGPGGLLRRHGIATVAESPGVGANLQDHLQLRAIYRIEGAKTLNETYHSPLGKIGMAAQFALFRTGPLTMAPSQLGIFTRSSVEHARANIQFHVQPLSLDRFGEPLHRFPGVTVSACNLRPTSRGSVAISSADPAAAPVIAPNYLASDADRRVAADTIRVTRRLMRQPALAVHRPSEVAPGAGAGDDDASLVKCAGDIGTTIFHPVGTAKMGADTDPSAVLDARLRVRGVRGLRVVDASAMPSITSGNTCTPTVAIAEKGSRMIVEDRRLRQ